MAKVLQKKSPARPAKKKVKKRLLASEQFKSESRFYSGEDIKRPFDAVIADVTREKMPDNEERWVIWLEDHEKGIVLNLGNGQQLGENLGDDMAKWKGCQVHVYTEPTRNPKTGKVGPGIRVCGADASANEEDESDDEPFEDDDDLD